MCWGLKALFRCLGVEMLNCLSSQRTTDEQLNRPEASTPNNDHVPGVGAASAEAGKFAGYRCRGVLHTPPQSVPAGTGAGHIYSALHGPSNGGECNSPLHGRRETRRGLHQKPIRSPKPAGNCTKNRFEARNPPRIAPKTDLKPRNPPRIAPKTDLTPETRRGLGQKQVFGLRRPSFHTSTHKQINNSTGL